MKLIKTRLSLALITMLVSAVGYCYYGQIPAKADQDGVQIVGDSPSQQNPIPGQHCTTPTYVCNAHACKTGMQVKVDISIFNFTIPVGSSKVTANGTAYKTCQPAEATSSCQPWWYQCGNEYLYIGACPGYGTLANIILWTDSCK
jgi:hypothetical protein